MLSAMIRTAKPPQSFPSKFTCLDASAPHPPKTQYKISIGTEVWDGTPIQVTKVQMVYDGKVEGRKSPSYPTKSNDFERVCEEAEKLIKQINKEGEQQ